MGTKFENKDKNILGREALTGYKLILFIDCASWWPGCAPFKTKVLEMYNLANKS